MFAIATFCVLILKFGKFSSSLVVLADDDQDDEEDAGDGDCNKKDDEGRHLEENLHQIEANEEKRPSKFEEDIVLTDRDCGKRNQLGKI